MFLFIWVELLLKKYRVEIKCFFEVVWTTPRAKPRVIQPRKSLRVYFCNTYKYRDWLKSSSQAAWLNAGQDRLVTKPMKKTFVDLCRRFSDDASKLIFAAVHVTLIIYYRTIWPKNLNFYTQTLQQKHSFVECWPKITDLEYNIYMYLGKHSLRWMSMSMKYTVFVIGNKK